MVFQISYIVYAGGDLPEAVLLVLRLVKVNKKKTEAAITATIPTTNNKGKPGPGEGRGVTGRPVTITHPFIAWIVGWKEHW